jgi:hypothetical protein
MADEVDVNSLLNKLDKSNPLVERDRDVVRTPRRPAVDQVPDQVSINERRLVGLVDDISSTALSAFHELRQGCDEVMRALGEEKTRVVEVIEVYAAKADTAMRTSKVAHEAMQNLQASFKSPTTITPKHNNGR